MRRLLFFIILVAGWNHLWAQEANLMVSGAIRIGNSSGSAAVPGTIRWTGNKFEGFTGRFWLSLGKNQPSALLGNQVAGIDLEVQGAIRIGNSNASNPKLGTLRWTGDDFEIWNGVLWASLTGNPLEDVDGNTYHYVEIGTQKWMKENLRTTKYNDGALIPEIISTSVWSSLGTGAFCWYDNNSISYENVYGKLYNWYAVASAKLCPTGWRVPTQADWIILENFLGGSSVAGGKMKEAGSSHWISPNVGATDESGFTGTPGSGRLFNGSFFDSSLGPGNLGYWWTASLDGTLDAFARALYANNGSVGSFLEDRKTGLSVRCIMN